MNNQNNTNRKRVMLVSAAVILLCLTLLIGTTYALFTDTQSVKHHLSAGDLEITLVRTQLVKTTLDASGYLVTSDPDLTVVNVTGPSQENVFDIQADEKIAPGSRFSATMQVENHGDVAFGYWVEIVCTDKKNGENLARQLNVTVTAGSEAEARVGDGLVVMGPGATYIDELGIGQTGSFVVTVEFLDSFVEENGIDANDLAQGEEISFDLLVHAVQITTK
jgi:predicted ribosomally synthesized peptide with SipW-like signal peptide